MTAILGLGTILLAIGALVGSRAMLILGSILASIGLLPLLFQRRRHDH